MDVFRGTAAFSGIAIGKILYYNRGEYQFSQFLISNVRKELESFRRVRSQVIEDLQRRRRDPMPPSEERAVSEQLRLLEGGSFMRAVEDMIKTEKVNAAYAVQTTRDELADTFQKLEDPVIVERISYVKELSNRLIYALGGVVRKISLGEDPVILVAESLSPTDILEMDKEKLIAVATHHESKVSHAAIMAKTMEIPCLVELSINPAWDGCEAIVDGYTGTLYLNPSEELLKEYEIRRQAELKEKESLLAIRGEKSVTADGTEVSVYANIGSLDELGSVDFYGACGIGLFRSEFQYLGRESFPEENELFRAYRNVAEVMGERAAVIRTVDLGGDKQEAYMNLPKEENPMMGNRGIRLCLDRKQMFRTQLRAIYRASAYGNLAVMYPMLSSMEELHEIEELTREVKEELDRSGTAYREIPVGIMIETPAAVMISGDLAKRVDFLSLGTNDLTQYTLAMDRQNPLLRKKYNDHHPAIFKMIETVIREGHANGCTVGICGELAADTAFTETFLRMGVDGLSVVPACILPIRKALQTIDLSV